MIRPARDTLLAGGLDLDAGERGALFLGFDDADGFAVDEQEVIGFAVAGLERELAEGDAAGGEEVRVGGVLDGPGLFTGMGRDRRAPGWYGYGDEAARTRRSPHAAVCHTRDWFRRARVVAVGGELRRGALTSDGGLPWLSEAEAALGVCAAFAACVPEWRRGPVRHALATLVRQRVLQIACGYEDQDDADTLRTDPLLKLVCGRLPETGADLASQPTLSRLENAVDRRVCYRLAVALGDLYLRERERDEIAATS